MRRALPFLLVSLALSWVIGCELFGANSALVVEDLTDVPADWIEFDAGGKFTFMGPPDLKKDEDVSGVDTFVEAYRGDRFDVFFDYGPVSPSVRCSPREEYLACRIIGSIIDGRPARVRISTAELDSSAAAFFGGPILYEVQARIDEVAEGPFGPIDLFFVAVSPQASDTTHLKVLVHSIEITEG